LSNFFHSLTSKINDPTDRKEVRIKSSYDPPFLTVSHLCFQYPDSTKKIIDNINFAGGLGEIIGITGPLASGKSTMGIILAGQYPYDGNIHVNGKELCSLTERARSEQIYYQNDPYTNLLTEYKEKANCPQIIILDEPLIETNKQLERSFLKEWKKNTQNSLTIWITNRITSFHLMDHIIFLNNKVEYGTHHELMNTSELYRVMFHMQITNC
jgi:ABC-type multidrug transport system fused ATPase/permease subunit